jgi:hypothetical protein
MNKTNIAFINASSVVNDRDAQKVMAALQDQVTNDFANAWGVDASLSYFRHADQVPAGHWQLVILDNSDQAGYLGYHDVTADKLPLGKIFAATDMSYRSEWSVTASHELLEMLADPDLVQYVLRYENDGTTTWYWREVCDACHLDANGYEISGVLVSDFLYPSWYQHNPVSSRFDHQDLIGAPFQLLPGGMATVWKNDGNGWQQIFGNGTELGYHMRAEVGSRRERRRTPRQQWLVSR